MNRIVLDDALIAMARKSMETVEVYDSAGNVVGLFTPRINPADVADLGPEISDEDIKRRIESKGPRYTTAEVIQSLEGL